MRLGACWRRSSQPPQFGASRLFRPLGSLATPAGGGAVHPVRVFPLQFGDAAGCYDAAQAFHAITNLLHRRP